MDDKAVGQACEWVWVWVWVCCCMCSFLHYHGDINGLASTSVGSPFELIFQAKSNSIYTDYILHALIPLI